jgi:hypothetical protein
MTINTVGRHPATVQVCQWFAYDHLTGKPKLISRYVESLATQMLVDLTDGPELTAGLRKLLEAKDCFVRQAVAEEMHP